jgi:hypothetical protein
LRFSRQGLDNPISLFALPMRRGRCVKLPATDRCM